MTDFTDDKQPDRKCISKWKPSMYNDQWQLAGFLQMEIFMLVEQSYNQKYHTIPGYEGLKSMGKKIAKIVIDENENSMFRCPLGLRQQTFSSLHPQVTRRLLSSSLVGENTWTNYQANNHIIL